MKISELPQATELTGEELLPIVQNGETKKTTIEELVGKVPDGIVIEDDTITLMSKGQKIGEGAELPQITVDSELSADSENPLQNKAVAKAISDLNGEVENSKSYADSNFSNALKGKVTGELLKIDDISPISHELKIKVQSDETDISDVTVGRYGKNQFNSVKNMIASFGKNPEYIENGFRVTNRGVTSQVIPVVPNTDYNLSYILKEIEGTTEKHVMVYRFVNGVMTSAIKGFENNIGGTFNTGNNNAIQIRFFGTPTNSDEGTVEFTNIQLELGTEATSYEPYVPVVEAEVSEDGTVNGITSAYPNTVIFADTPNVVLDCEYNKDLNKAFNKVIEAIVSLGGNV